MMGPQTAKLGLAPIPSGANAVGTVFHYLGLFKKSGRLNSGSG